MRLATCIILAMAISGSFAHAGAEHSKVNSKAISNRPADFSGVWQLSPKQTRTYDADAGLRQQPPLKPEWMQKWQKTHERQLAGQKVWDPLSRCLPPGMPRTMSGSYPMEILMTPGRVTVLTELFNETRRIWTDGRPHPPKDELEYTFTGTQLGIGKERPS